MAELERLEGEVVNIIYQSDDSGYKVVEVEVKSDRVVVVGYLHGLSVGEFVVLTGSWINHNVYGEQFKVQMFEKKLPGTRESIFRYLASGIIKGIRESTAKKIIEAFGDEALDVIANDPMRLAKIKGISKNKALSVQASYNEQIGASTLVMFLQKYNISVNYAAKIYRAYGTSAVELIEANPYMLCENIDGISFKTADIIAAGIGFSKNDIMRLRAGTVYTLRYYTQFGHSFLPLQELCTYSAQLLQVHETEIEPVIYDLIKDGFFDTENIDGVDRIYCHSHFMCENNVSKKLSDITKIEYNFKEKDINRQIDIIEKTHGIKLAQLQREAVACAMKYGVLVITGGPGTGKTTIINAIIDIMHSNGFSVTLTAPTGRAAKRMSQVCRCEAKTIHRLLEAGYHEDSGDMEFKVDENSPIDTDVIIIDEMSMVDIVLMNSLLKAVRHGTRLIMVGDVNQLPSVGPGNVLHDIIDSGEIKVIRLNEIFRQAKESMIVVNAHEVNNGNYPQCNIKDKDFFYMSYPDANAGYECILSLCAERLPKAYGYNTFDIQVLAPSKKGINGVHNLNKGLQNILNPSSASKHEKQYGDIVFREGDKVMQIKNNYDIGWTMENGTIGTGVFNGDVGVIQKISDNFNTVTVIYDDEKKVVYDFRDLDQIELAYAVTVHKSQGSEFSAVIMPMYDAPYMLINRNLFYTGITRARELVILVGREEIIKKMVDNNRENKRYSGLKEKIIAQKRYEIQETMF